LTHLAERHDVPPAFGRQGLHLDTIGILRAFSFTPSAIRHPMNFSGDHQLAVPRPAQVEFALQCLVCFPFGFHFWFLAPISFLFQ
jgi:hypothetical protein